MFISRAESLFLVDIGPSNGPSLEVLKDADSHPFTEDSLPKGGLFINCQRVSGA